MFTVAKDRKPMTALDTSYQDPPPHASSAKIDMTILRAMAAAGATVEVILSVIETALKAQAEIISARREKNRIRKRNQRARARDTMGQSVTGRDSPLPPSPSPSFSPPKTPPLTPPPTPPTRSVSDSSLRSESSTGADAPSIDLFAAYPTNSKAALYQRGQQILGKASGTQITKLLAAKNQDVGESRATLEAAACKGDPKAYLWAIIRKTDRQQEPEVVRRARESGDFYVEQLSPTRWKVGTEVYNERGVCVGA